MATKNPQKNSSMPSTKQGESELFAAFPEPQGWALNWDGPALQAASNTKTPGSRPTQQPRP